MGTDIQTSDDVDDDEKWQKALVIAKDIHEILLAHNADGNLCLNAMVFALAAEITAREAMGQAKHPRDKLIELIAAALKQHLAQTDNTDSNKDEE